jgi:membrane protein
VEKRGNRNHSLLKRLWHKIDEDDLPGLSAQMAYYFLLSMFPLLIFLFTLLPYLPIPQQDLLEIIRGVAPAEVLELLEKNLKDIMSSRHSGLLSFGIIGTIWSSSNGINAVVKAFNKAYNVKETRSIFVSSLMGIILTLGMILVFIVAIILPFFGKEIGIYFFSEMGYKFQFLKLWAMLRWFISAIMLFLIFTGLYWIAPNTKLRCRSAFAGAAFSTVGWIFASVALSFYVNNFSNFSITYGSIGAIIVLMLWLYITAFIIVLGGEINAFYSERNKINC